MRTSPSATAEPERQLAACQRSAECQRVGRHGGDAERGAASGGVKASADVPAVNAQAACPARQPAESCSATVVTPRPVASAGVPCASRLVVFQTVTPPSAEGATGGKWRIKRTGHDAAVGARAGITQLAPEHLQRDARALLQIRRLRLRAGDRLARRDQRQDRRAQRHRQPHRHDHFDKAHGVPASLIVASSNAGAACLAIGMTRMTMTTAVAPYPASGAIDQRRSNDDAGLGRDVGEPRDRMLDVPHRRRRRRGVRHCRGDLVDLLRRRDRHRELLPRRDAMPKRDREELRRPAAAVTRMPVGDDHFDEGEAATESGACARALQCARQRRSDGGRDGG